MALANSSEIQKWAEYAIRMAKEKFGQNLDYSENSLESLDSLIELAHKRFVQLTKEGNLSNDNLEKTIMIWGSFLGELIRRICEGKWIIVDSNILLSIDHFTINPFEHIRTQILKGSPYNNDVKKYFYNVHSYHLYFQLIINTKEINEVMLGILQDNSDTFPQLNSWIVAINKVQNLALQFPDNDINLLLPYSEKIRERFQEMLIVGENTVETLDDVSSSTLKKAILIPAREITYPGLVKSHQDFQEQYQLLEELSRLRSAADDIKQYETDEILKSGRFTAEERKAEYRRRGKSPSGVIDGVYNDIYLENGKSYSDEYRDWEADA